VPQKQYDLGHLNKDVEVVHKILLEDKNKIFLNSKERQKINTLLKSPQQDSSLKFQRSSNKNIESDSSNIFKLQEFQDLQESRLPDNTKEPFLKLYVTLDPLTKVEVLVQENDSPLEIVDKIVTQHIDKKKHTIVGEKRKMLAMIIVQAYKD